MLRNLHPSPPRESRPLSDQSLRDLLRQADRIRRPEYVEPRTLWRDSGSAEAQRERYADAGYRALRVEARRRKYASDPELRARQVEYHRRWLKTRDPEERRQYWREWYQKNRERYNEQARARYAAKKGGPVREYRVRATHSHVAHGPHEAREAEVKT
jgi:hypothetical protein